MEAVRENTEEWLNTGKELLLHCLYRLSSRFIQETFSVCPDGTCGDIRREHDLVLHLWPSVWLVPLSMKGVPLGHGLPTEQSHSGTFQANFLSVPLIQAETYRCDGSFRNSSHVWSSPSDPLYLSITGKKALYVSHVLWLRRS